MFCGAGSFSHVDGNDDYERPRQPPSPVKKREHNSKNPYASRGLDKFSAVLNDLESRRRKIVAHAGSQGVSVVKFMYKNSQDWIPVVVRQQPAPPPPERKISPPTITKGPPAKQSSGISEKTVAAAAAQAAKAGEEKGTRGTSWGWGGGGYYWGVAVVVLILVCLAMFGKSFAICCTCVWWYIMESMRGQRRSSVGWRRGLQRREPGRGGISRQ